MFRNNQYETLHKHTPFLYELLNLKIFQIEKIENFKFSILDIPGGQQFLCPTLLNVLELVASYPKYEQDGYLLFQTFLLVPILKSHEYLLF